MAELQFVFAGSKISVELEPAELAALLDVMADRYAKGAGFFLTIPVVAEDRVNDNLEQYWLSSSTQLRGLFQYNEIGVADSARVTELLTVLDIYPELTVDDVSHRIIGREDVLG